MQEKTDLRVPILIPTCNRFNHLEKCVESLARNKEAIETELYIAVDYPPSESFFDGYEKVVDYLKKLESNKNRLFKKVIVFYHHNNMGAFKNIEFLLNEARKISDCAFISEDDNIFSKKTLNYINTELEKYKTNNDVVWISAWNPNIKDDRYGKKIVLHRYASYYGAGIWYDKYDRIKRWVNCEELDRISESFQKMLYLRWKNKGAFNNFYNGYLKKRCYPYIDVDGSVNPIDLYISMYLLFNKSYCVYPSKNLVRNEGNDGSGLNSRKGDKTDVEISKMCEDYYLNDEERKSEDRRKDHQSGIINLLRGKKPFMEYLFRKIFCR